MFIASAINSDIMKSVSTVSLVILVLIMGILDGMDMWRKHND
jgi:hypothetical protein